MNMPHTELLGMGAQAYNSYAWVDGSQGRARVTGWTLSSIPYVWQLEGTEHHLRSIYPQAVTENTIVMANKICFYGRNGDIMNDAFGVRKIKKLTRILYNSRGG